jgi:hypothetical protein
METGKKARNMSRFKGGLRYAAKHNSRGTKPKCPLESINRFLAGENGKAQEWIAILGKVHVSRNEAGMSFRINKGFWK